MRFSMTLLIFAILALILLIGPSHARAHTITKHACAQTATKKTSDLSPWNQTITRWRIEYAACNRLRRAHTLKHACAVGKRSVPPGITVKRRTANTTQRRNLTRVLRVGRRMRANKTMLISAVAAVTQESSANNKPYGHGTSVGILQLINTHGTIQWRMRIENSATWYFRGAQKSYHRGIRPGRLAQRVQRSAHPTAYNQWTKEAARTVQKFLGPCTN